MTKQTVRQYRKHALVLLSGLLLSTFMFVGIDISSMNTRIASAQGPTSTPTPNPCPDGEPCSRKRYAHRARTAHEGESIQGIYGFVGAPSVPCVKNPQTNYSLWVADRDSIEFLEFGTMVQPDGSHYIFSGCTICTRFWGNYGAVGREGNRSLRIERLPSSNPSSPGCWLWYLDGKEVRNTCTESLRSVNTSFTDGISGMAGGETDSYFNDMGVQDYSDMAIKFQASSAPLFSYFSWDQNDYWIYTSKKRYASNWEDHTLQILSDNHWLGIADYCNGR